MYHTYYYKYLYLFLYLGDIEVFFAFITILCTINVIFCLLKCIFYKNIFFINNMSKNNKSNFYECGVKPLSQNNIKINVNYVMLSIFFILYDSELLFILPIIYNFNFFTLFDFALIMLYFYLFIISLLIDFEKNSLIWQK